MTATRSTVELWEDLTWLQGAAGDGSYVHSAMVRCDELEAGNLVRHAYRRTCVDGSVIDEGGWWVVDRVQAPTPGWLGVVHLIRLETGTGDGLAFTDGDRVEVRTDTRVDMGGDG